jgi:hypothetical protein
MNPTNSGEDSKKCQCPIQFEGKIKGAGFVRRSTEKISWEEAKVVARSWEAPTGTLPAPLPEPQPDSELATAVRKKEDEPVTIERAAEEFLADIEARQNGRGVDELTKFPAPPGKMGFVPGQRSWSASARFSVSPRNANGFYRTRPPS